MRLEPHVVVNSPHLLAPCRLAPPKFAPSRTCHEETGEGYLQHTYRFVHFSNRIKSITHNSCYLVVQNDSTRSHSVAKIHIS
ncbi:hypothetical protein Mapa_003856 [Marchantia paleacea]|nr:hypothetical protein Mapa_003856 [Marchantia paleacea]